MSEKIKKVPKLRFPEFTDEWEQCKLGEVVERITRKNKNLESNLTLSISAQEGLVSQKDFFNKQVAAQDLSNYYLIYNGEFAYNKSYSNGYPFGAIKRLDLYEKGVLSTLYIVFSLASNEVLSNYLALYYSTNRWYKDISERVAEGARNHGLLNIAVEDFFDIKFIFPKEKKEQEKIGNFFKSVDDLITIHQRKLENLKKQKKSLLQKMFPKNGSNFPEIRFPEFTDAWEQCKLGEVVDIKNGMDYKHLAVGKIPVYGTSGYMLSVDKALSYKEDAIGIGRKGTIDKPYILQAPFWTVDTLFYCIPRKSELYFAFCIFQGIKWKDFDESTGVPSLTKNSIKNIKIIVPKEKKEQEKIGNFFKTFDDLITIHQCKLENLKKLKKGLLQQMFI